MTDTPLRPDEILRTAETLRRQIGGNFHEQLIEDIYADAARPADRAVTLPDAPPRFDLDRAIDYYQRYLQGDVPDRTDVEQTLRDLEQRRRVAAAPAPAPTAPTAVPGTAPPTAAHIGDIMLGFQTAAQLPTSYALATSFAVCDHWFSSIPGPTWPNRMFVHAASSAGLDHSPSTAQIVQWESVSGFAFPHGSIYQALTAGGLHWRIYKDNNDA